jgi:hypothetical protein
MKLSCLACLLIATSLSIAAETNKVFVTDDGFLFHTKVSGEVIMDPQKVEAAKSSRESLPADQFSEGNWGTVTNGFQLSIRFDKQVYAVGEPVVATVLLRNTTSTTLRYFWISSELDSPVDFVLTSGAGAIIPPFRNRTEAFNSGNRELAPYTQHKYVSRLNTRFDLSANGKYTVCARYILAFQPDRVAESGKVSVEIKDPSSPGNPKK